MPDCIVFSRRRPSRAGTTNPRSTRAPSLQRFQKSRSRSSSSRASRRQHHRSISRGRTQSSGDPGGKSVGEDWICSAFLATTRPKAASVITKLKVDELISLSDRQAADKHLLYASSTLAAPPPQARRWHWREAPSEEELERTYSDLASLLPLPHHQRSDTKP